MQIPFWQRLLAPLMYLLPWSDAIPFGLGADGVFNQIPLLRLLIVPAVPLILSLIHISEPTRPY